MGSDPQYAKYPDLSLAQHVLTVTNPHSSGASRHAAVQKLSTSIRELGMAPLYRHLAHPTEGVLNGGNGGAAETTTGNVGASTSTNPTPARSASLAATAEGEEGSQKQGGETENEAKSGAATGLPASIGSFMTAQLIGDYVPPASSQLIWDEQLYQSLTAQNEAELAKLHKEEEEAAEAGGETEIQAARGKRAEFYARVGDKVRFALCSFLLCLLSVQLTKAIGPSSCDLCIHSIQIQCSRHENRYSFCRDTAWPLFRRQSLRQANS